VAIKGEPLVVLSFVLSGTQAHKYIFLYKCLYVEGVARHLGSSNLSPVGGSLFMILSQSQEVHDALGIITLVPMGKSSHAGAGKKTGR
jgi:hypothetical protein